MSKQAMSVAEMKQDQWGQVEQVLGEPWLCTRLMEIGFTPGEYIRRVAASPFNDPIVVNVRGTSFALRKQEASCIKVTLLS